MRDETEQLLAAVSTEEAEKMYDHLVKKIFRNKEIMAPILKMVVSEYKNCSLEEIIACMDDIAFEDIPVSDIKSMQIKGDDTELSSIEEKGIRYDLHFKARNPKLSSNSISVYLHFDVEMQNDYRPGYPIAKRSIYYAAREISEQLGILTETTDYSSVGKVYCIWICNNKKMPKKLQNTVSEYYIAKKDLIGHTQEPKEDYDLIDIIMIRRGNDPSDEQILDYLNNLMKADLAGIRTYSNVEWPENLKEEESYMSGFADSLLRKTRTESEARGEARGKAEGKTEEMQANIRSMQKNGLSAETIAQYLNKSIDVVKSFML